MNIQVSGNFSPDNKFTGQKHDQESNLYNYGARYYNAAIGKFTQSDPLTLYLTNEKELKNQTGKELMEILSHPIALNAYAYANNNPVIYVDPNGEQGLNVFFFLSQNTQVAIGNWANRAYDNNSLAKYAMDHPYQTGIAAGLVAGAVTASVVVGTGGAIACGALCGGTAATVATTGGTVASTQGDRIGQYVQKYGQSIADKMGKVAERFSEEGIKISEHGLYRTVTREARGINVEKVIDTFKQGMRYWDKVYNNISYFKDGIRIAVDEAKQITTVVTQNSIDLSRFIKLD